MRRRVVVVGVAAGVGLTVVIAVLSAKPAAPEIVRIGVLGPLTGSSAAYGISQLRGVRLAVDEINSSAELPGRKIELVVKDDEGKQQKVGALVIDLIYEHRIAALIGYINSATTHVAQMVTVKSHVPIITTTSTDPSITKAGSPWTFRCLADDTKQAAALGRYVFGTLGLKRVALLQHDNRYGKMGAREVHRQAKEAGHEIVAHEKFATGAKDFTPQLKRIAQAKPEAVIIWGLYTESALVTKQVRSMGLPWRVFGSDGLVSPAYLQLAGEAAEGVVVTYPFDPTRNDPRTQRFIERYRTIYGEEPDSFAAHSYDATHIIKEAIRRGGTDRESIKEQMALTKDFHGVTGYVTFDKDGNDTRDVTLAQVRDGRFVVIQQTARG